jgi:Zn-dependent protease/CBS domain-containing protein
MKQDVRLGRVAGVTIGANWTLLVVFGLFTWVLAAAELPTAAAGYSTSQYWAAAFATSVVFFGCLVAHEVAHAVTARHHGIGVDSIVLWMLGGISKLEREPSEPGDELRIALAGPLASLALAASFLACAGLASPLRAPALLVAALGWLGWVNAILAVFNLVPAFPLDGGRVLRAWLWQRRGDKVQATVSAARAGRTFGFVLVGLGVLDLLAGGIEGLWFALLGWFLLAAAGAEAGSSVLDERLGAVCAGDVMTPCPVVVPDWVSVQRLIDEWILPGRQSSYPTVDVTGHLSGVVTTARLRRVPVAARPRTAVHEAACPRTEVVTCGPHDPLVPVVRAMLGSADHVAVVLEADRVVGIVTTTDATTAIDRAQLAATS